MLQRSKLLILVAIWLLAMGGFWFFPPPDPTGEGSTLVSFSRFLATVLLGVMIFPMRKWCTKRHARAWITLGGVALVLGAAVFFLYQSLESRWTFPYRGIVLFLGSEEQPYIAEYRQEYPGSTTADLLGDATWKPELIWTEASIARNRLVLSAVYVFCVPLFACGLMAAAQVVTCAYGAGAFALSLPKQRRTTLPGSPGGRIFLSYSRADTEFCLDLARDLKQAGHEVWIDQLDIPAGAPWDAEVEKALREAGTVIVILSPTSVASQNVLDEASFAIDDDDLVVPILYRPCEVPLRLRRLQQIDFTADYAAGLAGLLAVLEEARRKAAEEAGLLARRHRRRATDR